MLETSILFTFFPHKATRRSRAFYVFYYHLLLLTFFTEQKMLIKVNDNRLDYLAIWNYNSYRYKREEREMVLFYVWQ
jgi:hypothetical protein